MNERALRNEKLMYTENCFFSSLPNCSLTKVIITHAVAMANKTFYSAIKPLLIMNKCLGLISFKLKAAGYQISKANVIFNVLLSILYVVIMVDSLYRRSNLTTTSLLMTTTDIMQVSTSGVQTVVSWMASALLQKNFISFLTRIAQLDKKFCQLGIWIYYDKVHQNITLRLIGHLIFVFLSVTVQVSIFEYAWKIGLITFNFTYYFPILINMGIVEQMSSYNNLLKERFNILNQHLTELQKSDGFGKEYISNIKLMSVLGTKLSTLRIICPMHHELTKIAKLINETFGVMLLLSFGVGFVTIIVSLYDCSISLQNFAPDKLKSLCGSIALCSTYVLDCLFLCYICHSTIEAANKAGRLLHQIETDDEEEKDQIEMFSLQIVNEKLEFTAAGFFPINYTLVFSIIGGITTYLIILIQFSANPLQKPQG